MASPPQPNFVPLSVGIAVHSFAHCFNAQSGHIEIAYIDGQKALCDFEPTGEGASGFHHVIVGQGTETQFDVLKWIVQDPSISPQAQFADFNVQNLDATIRTSKRTIKLHIELPAGVNPRIAYAVVSDNPMTVANMIQYLKKLNRAFTPAG